MKSKLMVTSLTTAALASLFLIGGQNNTVHAASLDGTSKSELVGQKPATTNTVTSTAATQNKENTASQANANNKKPATSVTQTTQATSTTSVTSTDRQNIQQKIDDVKDKIDQTKDVLNSLDNTQKSDDVITISDTGKYKQALADYQNGKLSNDDINYLMGEYKKNTENHQKYTNKSEDNAGFDMNQPNKDQVTALSLYTNKIINSVKTQLGLPQNKVSNGSIQFAYDIAKAYNDDYKSGTWTSHWHDIAGIKGVARGYGLPTLSDPDNQAYENAFFGKVASDDQNPNVQLTLGYTKSQIFDIINGMIFGTPGYDSAHQEIAHYELDHASGLLNYSNGESEPAYTAAITTYINPDLKSGWPEGYHFLGITKSMLNAKQPNTKDFDTTEVTYDTAKATANSNLEQYQKQLADLQSDLDKLNNQEKPNKDTTDNKTVDNGNTNSSNTDNVVVNDNTANTATTNNAPVTTTTSNPTQSTTTSTQTNANNTQETSNPTVDQSATKKSINLKLVRNAFVYDKNGHIVKTSLLKKAKSLKAASLKIITIKGKKFLKIGDNQYVKAANATSEIVKKNTTAKLRTNKRRKVRLYTSAGKFTKKYMKVQKNSLKFTAQRLVKGKMFYKLAKKNVWIKATDLVF